MSNARRRVVYLALAVVTLVTGLVWRLVLVNLPPFLYKYGGSVLWAAMIYWVGVLIAPRVKALPMMMVCAAAASAVECFKLVHSPGLEVFRTTLAGKLLLGRFFHWADFLAYYLAISAAALVDAGIRRRAQRSVSGTVTIHDRTQP